MNSNDGTPHACVFLCRWTLLGLDDLHIEAQGHENRIRLTPMGADGQVPSGHLLGVCLQGHHASAKQESNTRTEAQQFSAHVDFNHIRLRLTLGPMSPWR